jgi:2-dehydro-3-deoxyphosphooctonate aldolase (KDO 8-P synthase)
MNNQKFAWLKKISGNADQLFFILGPCSMENEAHTLKIAEFLKQLSEKLKFNLIFKASFDKANRISGSSYRSVGLDEGLRILALVREQFDLPVITDVHEVDQVQQVASVVDVLQTPAMLCRQTDLLVAAGKTGLPVNIKKGQFLAPENMEGAIQKVTSTGNEHAWICERGFTFGYNNLVVDYRNFPIMKRFGKPCVMDVTHAVQRPGGQGSSSGGDRNLVPGLAAAAIVQGIAGMFMEVHDNPDKALSDGPNTIRLSTLESLLAYLIDLDAWTKQRGGIPEVW